MDAAKFVAALLVIGIHTAVFSDLNSTIYFAFVQIICRTAVPFFAVCTGYYIGTRVSFRNRLEKTEANRSDLVRGMDRTLSAVFYPILDSNRLVFSHCIC